MKNEFCLSGCFLRANFKVKTALKTSRVFFVADHNKKLVGTSAQQSGLEVC